MDFQEIEERFASLRAEYEAGRLDADSFQVAVDELRIEDDFGRQWMIGIESGYWFYFDGNEWIQADPRDTSILPYVDEDGTYWSLNEESGEWLYFDGNDWVSPESEEAFVTADTDTAYEDDSEYFQDEEGRYWTIGKKSGEWYYYDELGWHKASESTPSSTNQPASRPVAPQPAPSFSPSSPPQTGAFHPIHPTPDYLQNQPAPFPTNRPSTQPIPSQQTYDPPPPASAMPTNPTGYDMPQQPASTSYDYTQPMVPQPTQQQPPVYNQPPPAYNQPPPVAPQPYSQPNPVQPQNPYPASPQPVESTEPGVWMYFDGETWLKYKDDPAQLPTEDTAINDYNDHQTTENEDDFLPTEEVIQVEDIDEFVEVVEVDEEDIIEADKQSDAVDAEFKVEVITPGERGRSQTVPVEPVTASPGPTAQTAETRTSTDAPPEFDSRIVPAWFWTSLVSVILLAAVGLLLVGILLTLNNREQSLAELIRLETPTLDAGVASVAGTPTGAPTPFPTPTVPATATPVPIANFASDYFGLSLDYPEGWVRSENDYQVIFAPSTRSLDSSKLNGAAVWIDLAEDADQTSLFADGLERFSPISERLEEGSMSIGGQSWLSAQIRFDSPEFGREGIALVATTIQDGLGYTLVAVAPADEWEDYIRLFQFPVNSLQFVQREIAVVATPTTPPTATETRVAATATNTATSEAAEDEEDVNATVEDDDAATSTPEPEGESDGSTPEPEEESDEANSTPEADPEEEGDDSDDVTPTPSIEEDSDLVASTEGLTNTVSITTTNTLTATTSITTENQVSDTSDESDEDEGPEESETLIYEVASGDTLGAIAIRFGLGLDALIQANGLDADNALIRVGQELTIPQGDAAIATAVAEAALQAASEPTATPVPAAAPVSGRIIYPVYSNNIRSYDIWSTNVDGTNQVIIVGNASQPQFTRDGSLFAYRSWQTAQRGVYFIDFPGGRQDLLTGFIEDGLPAWSSDGTFVISSRREGDRAPRLYRVRQDRSFANLEFNGEYPDILSDGRIITRGCSKSGECGLWVVGPNGGGSVKISSDTSDNAPAAHPAGGPIVFMSFDRGSGNNWEIWSMNPDGSNPQRLTENGANDGLPVWSPDGNNIAFVSDREGWGIWVMNPDGSNQRKLFNMPGSPDGRVQIDEQNSRGWLEERISWIP
ncbi:MAG: LysM peptidoglycan-binding domain-containing protein [Chloroflexota bacterium]